MPWRILIIVLAFFLMATPAIHADSSGRHLASYYERHMALDGDVAFGWIGRGTPQRLLAGVQQVGVSRDAFFALLTDGSLRVWADSSGRDSVLMHGVAQFSAGATGWFAIDTAGVLWHGRAAGTERRRIATEVVDACIGDSADYFVRRDGSLLVKGLAHRGQYGDGKLAATPDFVATALDAVAVKSHTGHALYLRRDGAVMGTGGNRFGPLGSHGLGDKADRWGQIFDGATAIATGSRHSLALRADGSLWAWGEGFAITPARVMERVRAVAAGDTVTLALAADGTLWQWNAGRGPERVALPG